MTFKCPCGKTIEYATASGCYNIGDAANTTGWTFLPADDGGALWLCKSCTARATPLAEELFKILGTTYAHVPSLLKTLKD